MYSSILSTISRSGLSTNQGEDKLYVRVEAEQDGKMSGIDFEFVKAD